MLLTVLLDKPFALLKWSTPLLPIRYIPRSNVPTQSARSRSQKRNVTASLLPSKPNWRKGSQEPCSKRCRPIPGPASAIPTNTDSSEAEARATMPSLPLVGVNFLLGNTVTDPSRQRSSALVVPVHKVPGSSSTRPLQHPPIEVSLGR